MLQAPKRKTSLNTDALTGQWLQPGLPTYVVSVPMKRQRPRYLEAGNGETIAAPMTLHRNQQEGAVGLEYSLMMLAYLNALVDELRRERRMVDRAALAEALAWWKTDYGVGRVRAGLLAKWPGHHETALQVLEIVLVCHREQAEPAVIATRYGKSGAWVYDKIDLCMRIAGYHRQACGCAKCAARKAQAT